MSQLKPWFIVVLAVALLGLLATPAFAAPMEATITNLAKDSVSVTDNQLQEWQFRVDELTQILVNGKEAKLSDLKLGDTVTIDYAEEQEDDDTFRAIEIRLERK